MSDHVSMFGGAAGNREVPRASILDLRGDLRAAQVEAYPEEEGGSWGRPGFPHGSEPQASDERGVFA